MQFARLRWRDALHLVASLGGLLGVVAGLHAAHHINPTTAAVCMLVVVLATAALARLAVAVVSSVIAMLALNFFFFPPLYTFTIAEPPNWVALLAFLTVSVFASQLSAAARTRAQDAIDRRNELGRLFDLSRDVLLTTETVDALDALARYVARRFELREAALCVPTDTGWAIHQGGEHVLTLHDADLNLAFARAGKALEFDAKQRTYSGHTLVTDVAGLAVVLVPLQLGTRAIGLLACLQEALEPGTLDAIAGLAAIAIERIQLLSERKEADLVRQRADLAAALLASLSHDLRTPLTAASMAVANLRQLSLPVEERDRQARVAEQELARLTRLVEDILDMARIDAAGLTIAREWVTPADIVDAALANLTAGLGERAFDLDADDTTTVDVDPRVTSAALSHLIENAVQYSRPDQPVTIRGWVDSDGLHFVVRDHGPGLDVRELDHLFERFYRGHQPKAQGVGTGMGLAITRGLLAAEGGRVWGENAPDGGAQFSMVIPTARQPVADAI